MNSQFFMGYELNTCGNRYEAKPFTKKGIRLYARTLRELKLKIRKFEKEGKTR